MYRFERSFLLPFTLMFCADQWSKYLAGKFLHVSVNNGFSFGFFSSRNQMYLIVLTLVLLVCGMMWLISQWKHVTIQTRVALAVVFGAAVSNVLDRIIYGGVRDWLSVPYIPLKNNLADWGIFLALAWTSIVQLAHGTSKNPDSFRK